MADEAVDDALDVEGRQHRDGRLDRDGLELAVGLDLERPAHDEEQVRDALVAVEDGVEQVIEMRFLHGERALCEKQEAVQPRARTRAQS